MRFTIFAGIKLESNYMFLRFRTGLWKAKVVVREFEHFVLMHGTINKDLQKSWV